MSLLWINGELVDKSVARISPFDHGFLYGDGVWESLRVFNGELMNRFPHMASLFNGASKQGIDIPMSMAELQAAIETTVLANNRTEGYIRVIVTRGPGTLGPDPRKLDPYVIIIVEEYQPFPQEVYEHGLQVVTRRENRPDDRTLSRAHIVAAKLHALTHGCLDALLVNEAGQLLGSTEGELFIVKSGTLIGVDELPENVQHWADDALIPRRLAHILLDDLLVADEAFLAGTSCGVIGIVQVDGQPIGSGTEGPITKLIREAYRQLTRGAG